LFVKAVSSIVGMERTYAVQVREENRDPQKFRPVARRRAQ
jgi:hypothetical protein